MGIVEIIKKKRDGGVLSEAEIHEWIGKMVKGEVPDYQSSALLMAIFLKGMDREETKILTMEMLHSGDVVAPGTFGDFVVDKHSTGGVGDKTTLVIGAIVAACGVKVAKMSGRGLGHTGGTLDKMESIPGVRCDLSTDEFAEKIKTLGIAIAGQTGSFAPADKILYALRDVTGTVESLPLIASSIMSKKLACGADGILLDVKYGSGAFMKTPEDALELARVMVKLGEDCGRIMGAMITNMDVPLGANVGNLLEVFEAMDVLEGRGPKDLTEECKELAEGMLILAGKDPKEAKAQVEEALSSGKAYELFGRLITEQAGRVGELEELRTYFKEHGIFENGYRIEVCAPASGVIRRMDTEKVGLTSSFLGAGREKLTDTIDPEAGIHFRKKTGEAVREGEVLAELFTTSRPENLEKASEMLLSAMEIGAGEAFENPGTYATILPNSGKV